MLIKFPGSRLSCHQVHIYVLYNRGSIFERLSSKYLTGQVCYSQNQKIFWAFVCHTQRTIIFFLREPKNLNVVFKNKFHCEGSREKINELAGVLSIPPQKTDSPRERV